MRKHRRGSMLIEQVALMGISSTIFLIALGLLHQTLKYKRTAQLRTESVLATSRLAQQIRLDGMQCQVATEVGDEGLEFRLADKTSVRFRFFNGSVIREIVDSSTETTKIIARESYSIGLHCRVSFEAGDGQSAMVQFQEMPSVSSSDSFKSTSSIGKWSIVVPLGSAITAPIAGGSQ